MPHGCRLALGLALLLASTAGAEIYRGIGPFDTLGDVKSHFPNANVERLNPAWAQDSDAMYSFDGPGIDGKIIVKFKDERPDYRRQASAEEDPDVKAMLEKWASEAEDKALRVEWVRWVPFDPIPLKRFIAKYGPPSATGFRDDNMRPYREWQSGISANLDDDLAKVTDVEFSFSNDDMRRAWLERYGTIPDWLKELGENPPKPKRKTTGKKPTA